MGLWHTMRSFRRRTYGGRPPSLSDLAVTFMVICVLAVPGYLWLNKLFMTSKPAAPDVDSEAYDHLPGMAGERRAREAMKPPSPEEVIGNFQRRMGIRSEQAARARNLNTKNNMNQRGRQKPRNKPGRILQLNTLEEVKRPMKCTNCTHFPFPKLSKEIKNVCRVNERDNSSVVELVVLIASQPENFQGRLALRQTWLQISKRNKSKVRYLFLVGKPAKGPDQKKLEVEKKKHRDILQTTSQDAFNKQTEKMMIGLKWVTRHCRHARHVLKTEDDVWVNVPALLNWLKAQPLRQPFGVGGFCAPSNTPDRNPLSKYFIPKSIYPQEFYPPFCNAPGYLLTPHTARQVERMSKDVPYFPFDDVYLGFCLQAIRMQVQRVPGFSNDKMAMKTDSDKCRLLGKSVLLTHGYTPTELRSIWSMRGGGKCPRNKRPSAGKGPPASGR